MKVAIVSQPFDSLLPADRNSIGIWTYEVARRLADRCEITVFAKSEAQARQAEISTSSGGPVSYRFVRVFPSRVWYSIAKRVDRFYDLTKPFFASPLYFGDYAARVAAILRRSRFDVIHIHNFSGFVPIIRAANPDAKLVLHMNGEWLSQLDYALMDARIAAVDMVLGSSDHITGLVQSRFPHHADKCHTVYNGVDVDAFAGQFSGVGNAHSSAPSEDDESEVVLFVGRISPEKGVHDLINAFALVADRHPRARLELVGPQVSLPREFIVDISDDELVAGLVRFYDEDYVEQLHRMVPAELHDRVVFTGSISQAEVAERVRGAGVLVNPSYSESFGMALVEAMASEVPTVATRVGGMPEIVEDGATGYLVDPGDVGRLAEAIDKILSDRSLRRSMGIAGRARVLDRFSWGAVAESALARYRQLTSDTD